MSEIIYRNLNEIKKLENNPRTIKKEDMERLKTSIKNNKDYFEARPIILSDRTGELVILAGNQRYEAAKAIGMNEVPTFLLSGLTEEREREIIIRDNVSNGDWDMDILANEWDVDDLLDWGLDKLPDIDFDEIVDEASEGTIKEYDDDTEYDLSNLVRKDLSEKIKTEIKKAEESGNVRKEILGIIKRRAEQCVVFNFDEIIRFYRSGDASEEEKHLLEELYLVFLTPKETIEKGLLEIDKTTGEIYDRKLMGEGDDDEEETY